jgi:hypothetical protein
METIAARHGIYLAPLYNGDEPVEDGMGDEMGAPAVAILAEGGVIGLDWKLQRPHA